MKPNKKAQQLLSEHTVNVIIAVLCILVLIYLGVIVYNFFMRGNEELTQAKYTLDKIASMANTLAAGTEKGSSFVLTNPNSWVIASYEGKLCMCEQSYAPPWSDQKNWSKCCLRVSKPVEKNVILNQNCIVGVLGYQNCILVDEVPKTINFVRDGSNIIIGTGNGVVIDFLSFIYNGRSVRDIISQAIANPTEENKKLLTDAANSFFGDKNPWYIRIEVKDPQSVFINVNNDPDLELEKSLGTEKKYVINVNSVDYRINLNSLNNRAVS